MFSKHELHLLECSVSDSLDFFHDTSDTATTEQEYEHSQYMVQEYTTLLQKLIKEKNKQ